jgi:hypothetical protein
MKLIEKVAIAKTDEAEGWTILATIIKNANLPDQDLRKVQIALSIPIYLELN